MDLAAQKTQVLPPLETPENSCVTERKKGDTRNQMSTTTTTTNNSSSDSSELKKSRHCEERAFSGKAKKNSSNITEGHVDVLKNMIGVKPNGTDGISIDNRWRLVDTIHGCWLTFALLGARGATGVVAGCTEISPSTFNTIFCRPLQ
jgi:hypothetical protein